jgi:nucleoside-diphosphate-sugar epimerase
MQACATNGSKGSPMSDDLNVGLRAIQKLFCFGYGYSAQALARELIKQGCPAEIVGTRTTFGDGVSSGAKLTAFNGDLRSAEVVALLEGTTHVLLSIPPGRDGDLALRHYETAFADLGTLRWIGYLSTIGVYGDSGGAWIDETAAIAPQNHRAELRVKAEQQWRAFADRTGLRLEIFRLPGIYGPGRNMIDALRHGTARQIIKPGQVFNRVHVTDIARAIATAMALAAINRSPAGDTYNLVDDEPCQPQQVVEFAAGLLGVPVPPPIPFAEATLSPMARSFYRTSKRCSNARLKQAFQFNFLYPSYREGLRAIAGSTAPRN